MSHLVKLEVSCVRHYFFLCGFFLEISTMSNSAEGTTLDHGHVSLIHLARSQIPVLVWCRGDSMWLPRSAACVCPPVFPGLSHAGRGRLVPCHASVWRVPQCMHLANHLLIGLACFQLSTAVRPSFLHASGLLLPPLNDFLEAEVLDQRAGSSEQPPE